MHKDTTFGQNPKIEHLLAFIAAPLAITPIWPSFNGRAVGDSQGPSFRPAHPIWKIFATSSDPYMAIKIPESEARLPRSGLPHMADYCV